MVNQNNNQLEWKNVLNLYNNFINNRDDVETQNLFFNTAIKYVIQNPNCIICQNPEFCTELMYCFSCPPTGILIEFRKALDLQFRRCANCIEIYHEKLLPGFYKTSLPKYGKSGLDKFINDMIEWDVKRISTHLDILIKELFTSTEDIVQWKKIRSQSIFPLYEIFKYPIVLKSWDVETKFITLLKHLLEKRTKLTLFNNKMPGILILSLHHSDFIRQWATKAISNFPEQFPLSQADDLKSYFEDIIFYLENNLPSNSFKNLENEKLNKYYHYTNNIDDFLHGICTIINAIQPEILIKLSSITTKLFKMFTALFKHWKSVDVIFFFNTIEIFFKTLKIEIWDTKTTKNYEIIQIFKHILNNEQYKKILSTSEIFNQFPNKSIYFNWIFYFSQSAECAFPLVSVELWKYTIEQTNEWCEEAQSSCKLLIYETVQHLKKVEIVDILLQYCLKEMKESEHQNQLLEITKKKIEEDSHSLIENHQMICELDLAKSNNEIIYNNNNSNNNNKNINNENIDSAKLKKSSLEINEIEENIKSKMKSIHLLTWRYICSYDVLKGNDILLDILFQGIQNISFMFSDRHNYNQYTDNLVFIRRYIVNLFEELSEQTIDTLKELFLNENKLPLLIHTIFSCDETLSQISVKVLDKIMIKNIDDEIYDPVVLVFSEYTTMCIKIFTEKLNNFNILSKEKDVFCMLHFANSIIIIIERLIPYIGKITDNIEVQNSMEASIFNYLYQIINRCRQWNKIQPEENLLISQILHNALDIVSKIVKLIKNLGEECDFYNFKNDLVHFISPLSKQLIYENGRIYFDKIFNLMINILNFIQPPNKLDDKYLNILNKIYESNTLLSIHKKRLFEILKQFNGNNTTNFNLAYAMMPSTQIPPTLSTNSLPSQGATFNINPTYQQPYINQNQINYMNNNALLAMNSQNYNLTQKLNSNSLSYPNNSMIRINSYPNQQNNIFQQSILKSNSISNNNSNKSSENNSETITIDSDSKSTEGEKENSENIIVVDDEEDNGNKLSNKNILKEEKIQEKENDLKLKKIQEDLKKNILSNYKHQSKITDMKPLSPSTEIRYPIKTPFTMEPPKKVSVQKSIKIFSTTQSTNSLLNNKSVTTSSNPVHKMSSSVFNPPSPPPFQNKVITSGLKQPKSSIRIKSPKHSNNNGGKLSKLQSLRREFNLQRDQVQRRVPCGQLSKQTHSNPNFDMNSKLKEESESSSSSEDEGGEGILDLLNDYNPDDDEPVIKEKRQIKMLDDTPIIINRKKKIVANSVVTDAIKKKSNVDIKTLYRHVLSWNYNMKGNKPPNVNIVNKIPISFKSHEDYVKVFEPLILTECWAQFQKSKEDINIHEDIIKLILEDHCTVDDFEEIRFSANAEDIRGKAITENDILWLRLDDEKENQDENNNNKNSSKKEEDENPKYSFFVLISNLSIKKNEAILSCRAYLRGGNSFLITSLRKTSSWKTTKVFTCVTCNREYLGMKFIENSSLLNVILDPQNEDNNKKIIESRYVANLMDKYKLNESQAQSICGSVKSKEGFILIQGPPGTGKTKTILSLIAELKEKSLPKKVKILVCAPSNAGCDEIVRRLKRGVQKNNGEIYKPKLVRIGTEAIHPDCKDVTLDALVDDLFSNDMVSQNNINKSNQSESSLRKNLEEVHNSLEELRKKEEDAIINKHDDVLQQEISLKIGELIRKRKEIRYALESTQIKNKQILDQAKQQTKYKILNEADVVLSTLSGSGHDILSNIQGGFEIVIVDEAAQAVELSSLIPLKYGATKVILVGDPNQLPPTVISLLAQNYSYEQSLFKRLQINNPDSVYLLNVQYRMHPHISKFPSKHFYNSKIVNSMNMEKLRFQPWHNDKRFRPYQIINIEGKEAAYGTSLTNQNEVDAIIILVRSLCDMNPNINFATRIGIITPYNGQAKLLKRRFNGVFGSKILHYIDINTIDGFQGQEKDIIIFSCVRAHPKANSIGFLADVRRMNVGITRARNSLFIVGHLPSLIKNDEWRSLIEDGKERKAIRDFTKSNYEYNHNKIPLNIYSSSIKLKEDENKNEKENKTVSLKRSLKDNYDDDKLVVKKGKVDASGKDKEKNDDIELKKKTGKSKKSTEDENKYKYEERESKKLKLDTSSKVNHHDILRDKDKHKSNNEKEDKDSSTKIKSPSLKERYKEKVYERDKEREKEREKGERERENKRLKMEHSTRIKSPNDLSSKDKYNDYKSKSNYHHHHHHHHHNSNSRSNHSKSTSPVTLNNDTISPDLLKSPREDDNKSNKPIDFLDQLVNSVKTTEKIAKDKYPITNMRRH